MASWRSVNLAVFFFIVRMEISLFLWKILCFPLHLRISCCQWNWQWSLEWLKTCVLLKCVTQYGGLSQYWSVFCRRGNSHPLHLKWWSCYYPMIAPVKLFCGYHCFLECDHPMLLLSFLHFGLIFIGIYEWNSSSFKVFFFFLKLIFVTYTDFVDIVQAIDGGWLPDDLLEEIPCKYINGCVVCEVILSTWSC